MRIPNGKDCYPSFTGCFGNNPCLFTLQNAYFVRKRGSPLLVYLWPCVIPYVWSIFFLGWWGCTVTFFGQLLLIGARNIHRTVSQCCSGKIFAHGNAMTVLQSVSCFPSICIACVVEYEDGHTCQQSLQRFLVCDTLIIVSFVFLGSRCSYNFKEFFHYFVLLILNLLRFQASHNLLGSTGMLGVVSVQL